MLNRWERWVQFHQFYLASEPVDAPVISLLPLIPHWEQRIRKQESYKLIKNETASIRIADIKHDKKNNALVLLFQYADKNVTDPVFSNLEKGTLRIEQKLEGEGIAVSAHVVLSTKPYDSKGQLYHFLLEEVIGLGRSTIEPFIRSELKVIAKDLFTYNDDNNHQKNYLPAIEINGTPSQGILDEFDQGCVLNRIELIQLQEESPGINEETFYSQSFRHLVLTPSKSAKDNIKAALDFFRKKAIDEGYDQVKLRYKHPKGKQKTAAMNSSVEDVTDTLVVKSEQVKAQTMLDQCEQKIEIGIKNGMIKHLKTLKK